MKLRLSIDRFLVRPHAWWFNKVPYSISLMMLLLDGRPVDLAAVVALMLVVLSICAVGNYGYALNDLYDVNEDREVDRSNAASLLGRERVLAIVIGSAILAEVLAAAASGWAGAILTWPELCLPLIYSVPPWRLKERKWLGVAADALAAHVYPAMLALLAITHFRLHPVTSLLVVSLLAWSAAVGIRGILSHQLHTTERDQQAGLRTVVHDIGKNKLERFIVVALLPLECIGLVVAISQCDVGWVFWVLGGVYVAYEAIKTGIGGFVVTAFRPEGQPYIPLVEESFCKAWAPIIIALDAARIDPLYLIAIPLYWVLFRRHLRAEAGRLGMVTQALRRSVGAR